MKIVYDLTIYSNRKDYMIKPRLCQGTIQLDKDHAVITLEQSRNWFARQHFELSPGCLIVSEDSDTVYVVTDISFPDKRPFNPILSAVTVAPDPVPTPRKRGWPAGKPRSPKVVMEGAAS